MFTDIIAFYSPKGLSARDGPPLILRVVDNRGGRRPMVDVLDDMGHVAILLALNEVDLLSKSHTRAL